MKKKILILSPLLLVAITSNKSLAMDTPEDRLSQIQIVPSVTLQLSDKQLIQQRIDGAAKALPGNLFANLLQHPVFIEKKLAEKQATEQEIAQIQAMVRQQEEQEKLNLHISELIQGTIPTETETTTTPLPERRGLSWTLKFQSYYLRNVADLLLYTLNNDMFETDNKDHLALLGQAITYCTEHEAYDSLSKILVLTKQKHGDDITLSEDISKVAGAYLTTHVTEKITTRLDTFAQLGIQKQAILKATIEKLQQLAISTEEKAIKYQNELSAFEKVVKDEILLEHNNNRKAASALRKISKPDVIATTQNIDWNALIQPHKTTKKTIAQISQDLVSVKDHVQKLSQLLALEDKK